LNTFNTRIQALPAK